jgi:hypothetical protein
MNRFFSAEIRKFKLYVIAFIIIVLFIIGSFYLFISVIGLAATWIITSFSALVMAFAFAYIIKKITKNQT